MPLLNDRFRGTASKLPQATQDRFQDLKAALIERDEASIRNAASSFWARTKKKGTTALEHAQYVHRLVDRMVEGRDRDGFIDSLVKEVVTQDLPKEGRMLVRERKPETTLKATKLAEEYFSIREESYAAWSMEPAEQGTRTHSGRDKYSQRRGRRDSPSRQYRRETSPSREDKESEDKTPNPEAKAGQAGHGDKKGQHHPRPRRRPKVGQMLQQWGAGAQTVRVLAQSPQNRLNLTPKTQQLTQTGLHFWQGLSEHSPRLRGRDFPR